MTSVHVPTLMTGLAIVDGLRTSGINKVVVNCTYYESDWRDGFSAFLRSCDFNIIHVLTAM